MRLKSRRNWIPFFQFLLNVALVNSILLSREVGIILSKGTAEIRMGIVRDLVTESRTMRTGMQQSAPSAITGTNEQRRRRSRVRAVLPLKRLDPALHSVVRAASRDRCELCKIKLLAIGSGTQRAKRSFLRCSYCDVSLCSGKTGPVSKIFTSIFYKCRSDS
eukprot:IDg2954t1